MQIDYVSEVDLKKAIRESLVNIIGNDYKIFIFGSRVKGNAGDRSDIDIGITGQQAIDPATKLKAEEALENLPYLFKFDLVDFNFVDESFKEKALQYIEEI